MPPTCYLINYEKCFPTCIKTVSNPFLLYSGSADHKPRSTFTKAFMACSPHCKQPCADYWSYDFSLSQTSYMSDNTVQSIAQLLLAISNASSSSPDAVTDLEVMIRNMIAVQIYFDSGQVTVVQTSETAPILTFIANIGGQLGEKIMCRAKSRLSDLLLFRTAYWSLFAFHSTVDVLCFSRSCSSSEENEARQTNKCCGLQQRYIAI